MNAPHAEPAAHETAIDETSIRYEGWPIVAVCFLIATFAWAGGFYGQGVYLAELQRLRGWPASQISTATTFFYLFGAVPATLLSVAGGMFLLRIRRPIQLITIPVVTTAALWLVFIELFGVRMPLFMWP